MKYHIIHKTAIPNVLKKAKQYRLLLEPDLAISICIDIFAIDANNQEALIIYILALTDKLSNGCKVTDKKILDTIAKLSTKFYKDYYTGIFLEKKARAMLKNTMSKSFAYAAFMQAIKAYKQAEKLADKDCSDAILRYNSCLRTIEKQHLIPRDEFNELY